MTTTSHHTSRVPRLLLLAIVFCLARCCSSTADTSARLRLRMQRRGAVKHPDIKLPVSGQKARAAQVLHPSPSSTDKFSHPLTDKTSSLVWAPLIVSSICSDGMSPSWAPCIKDTVNHAAQDAGSITRIAHAEELIFPDFKVRIPVFGKEADKVYWLQKVSSEFSRACLHDGFAAYKVQKRLEHTLQRHSITSFSNHAFVMLSASCAAAVMPVTDPGLAQLPKTR